MKVRFPGVEHEFECGHNGFINSLVIENPHFFFSLLTDMDSQFSGQDGKTVISENDKVLPIDKYLELHSSFVPFQIDQKPIVNKIVSEMSKLAVTPEYYLRSSELLSEKEQHFTDLSTNMYGNIEFRKLSMDNLIKASGIEIVDDYNSLSEKLLDYFELVKNYDRDKVFVLVNLRSYLALEEVKTFVDEVLARNYQVLLIESREYPRIEKEKRCIIDESLCEIC